MGVVTTLPLTVPSRHQAVPCYIYASHVQGAVQAVTVISLLLMQLTWRNHEIKTYQN